MLHRGLEYAVVPSETKGGSYELVCAVSQSNTFSSGHWNSRIWELPTQLEFLLHGLQV